MPKIIKQLESGNKKIIAYDEKTCQFFIATLEPIKLASLSEDEIVEAAKMVTNKVYTGDGWRSNDA